MRKLILAAVAAAIASVPLATMVKAQDTTPTQKGTMSEHKMIKKHENRATSGTNKKMMQHGQNY